MTGSFTTSSRIKRVHFELYLAGVCVHVGVAKNKFELKCSKVCREIGEGLFSRAPACYGHVPDKKCNLGGNNSTTLGQDGVYCYHYIACWMTIARDLTDATMQIQLCTTADHLYDFHLSTRGICFINSSCTLLLTHNKIVFLIY